jgi:hypothetical protein
MPLTMDLAAYNAAATDGSLTPPGIDSAVRAEISGANVVFIEPADGGSAKDKEFVAAASKRNANSL